MKIRTSLILTVLMLFGFLGSVTGQTINEAWINEFHYDNAGADVGEFVEIVIENPGNYTLSDFTVSLYNGSNGTEYGSETLDNLSGNIEGDFTIYTWSPSSIQNGGPDGISLTYNTTVIQFISYEGSFTAANGPASGVTSTDVGVEETGSTQIGESLYLTGSGVDYSAFSWTGPGTDSPGSLNTGQSFVAPGATALKLAVTEINGGSSPTADETFEVVIEAQDGDSNPANVDADTDITLTLATGNGNLSGTLTGVISSGSNSVTISGVSYDEAESGVSITASDDASGLTSGTSSTFEVLAAADELIIVDFPSEGISDNAINSFTVEARRSSDNSVDQVYSESITISKTTGSGNIGGTLTKTAENGVATFDDITFSGVDDYAISATDGSLTSSTSSIISIGETPGIVLNEFLADPASGADPNGDGTPDTGDDEFIEFVNTGNSDLDISGWTIDEGAGLAHTFPASTILEPMQAIVIFSGGSAVGDFGGSLTQISTEGYALNNGGDDIILKNDSGVEIINYTYGSEGGNNQSITRNPDLSGSFAQHTTADTNDGSAFSPGTRIDGSTFQPSFQITGEAGWRMLSFPITGGTVADISDDTAIQGIIGGDNESEEPNFLIFKSGTATADFATPTDVNTSFGDGFGFITYFYDNTTSGSSELPLTLDVSGAEPSGDVTVPLNTEDDYTLAGNPFASNYDLSVITTNTGAIQDNLQFWDNSTAVDLSSFIVIDRNGADNIVGTWQGFWVENNGAENITFPASGKTTNAADVSYSKQKNSGVDVDFTLSSEESFDKAIRMSFRDDAELGWDKADATKFTPLTDKFATIAFVGDEKLQSVFSIPSNLEEEVEVKLQETLVGVSGEFTFGWEGIESLPEDWNFTLHDYETGKSINMRHVDSYTFEAEAQAKARESSSMLSPQLQVMKKSAEEGRFGITVRAKTATSNESTETPRQFKLEQNYPNPFNPSTNIQYSVEQAGPVTLTVYNVIGQKIATLVSETKAAGSYRINWDAANMASGIYHYRLQSAGQVITRQMTLIK